MEMRKVAIIVGSLRKESYTKKIAKLLQEIAPESLNLEFVDISKLEIYNQDIDDEGTPTAAWTEFRETVKGFDAVLFATPEYNRSMPAALKNAVDVGSRPYGKSIWDGKPGAVISVSPGAIGAFGANHHLRQSLIFINIPTMPQPEAYVGGVATMFDDNGVFTNDKSREFLQNFMNSFAAWIEKNI
jgi:chromate reductase